VSEPWRIKFSVSGEIEVYPPGTGGDTSRGAITFTTQKETRMGEIVVPADEQFLSATVVFQDSEGNPTTPDTTPQWVVTDESVAACEPSEDGLSAKFTIGSPGVTSVSVTTTETHQGGQFTDIVLTGLITVVAADVVTGSIDFTTDHVEHFT
jgi:hypothetical protein